MSHDRVGFKNLAFNLPDNGVPPNCDDGAVWSNISAEEAYICLGGESRSIPHSGYHRARILKTLDQSVGVAFVDVGFDDEDYDVGNIHDNVINNERISIIKDGLYLIMYQLEFESGGNVQYSSRIRINDTDIFLSINKSYVGVPPSNFFLHTADAINLLADDYVTLQAQSGTGAKDVLADNSFLAVIRAY